MNKKVIALIAIVIALLVAVPTVALLRSSSNKTTPPPAPTSAANDQTDTNEQASQPAQEESSASSGSVAPSSECAEVQNPVITASSGSFSPSCITVASGTEISWKNSGSQEVQIGVDPHPSHTGNRQLTNNEFVLQVRAGQTATSTTPTAGEYQYHDHLNPTAKGTVIVR
jgi:plastocyanin